MNFTRTHTLTFLILHFCSLQTYAQQTDKKITITFPAQPLNITLQAIEKQYGISFAYEFNQVKAVTTKGGVYTNVAVSSFLTELLSETDLQFEEKNQVILIKKRPVVQQKKTISGYVEDGKTGERLLGVSLYIPGTNKGTVTNNFGFFSITIDQGDAVPLRISYLGFETADTLVRLKNDVNITARLTPLGNTLREVTIKAAKEIQHSTQMSSMDLPVQTIKSLPAFMGEVDIMKAIQLLPGVQAGSEGSSGVYVRGGGPDQNLILLDGVPVYNASHLFGFFSVFNADAIKNVSVIKGGFPARYGGRLSSVIDINMKEGDKNKLHGEGGIGLLASRLTLEGPIRKDKSSFVISGRRTYLDALVYPFLSKNKKAGYYFYDLNAKVNFNLGEKDHLYISGYLGNDKGFAKSSDFRYRLAWGNVTAVSRWNHEFSPKLFGNLTAYYSQYKFLIANSQSYNNQTDGKISSENRYTSGIYDKTLKYDFDFYPASDHAIKVGAGIIAHKYAPGVQHLTNEDNATENVLGANPVKANELDAYVEDDIRINEKLKTNIGLHWTGFAVRGTFFSSLQPRVSARYLLNDKLSVKASYAKMNQFIHLLTNSTTGLPTDLWVPATDRIPGQIAHQLAAGLAYTYHSGIELSAEGYYKSMNNIIEYKEGASFMNQADDWENKVETGKGKSYGAELFAQKKQGRFTGMLGYTLSWTNRVFANLNNGASFPYRYDRRHDIKIAGVYNLTPKINISAEWVFGSGNNMTLPIGVYIDAKQRETAIYGSRNGYRMAPYHRADISAKFIKQKKRYERAWVVSVYNVYNRKNPFSISASGSTYKQFSLFPFLPSASYQFKF